MGKATGFIEIQRKKQPYRPVEERLQDWQEVYVPYTDGDLRGQAARCMDCGVPFCHQGCPLGNLIPDWNDFVYRDRWSAAIERLHATNNFPEWTGRLCPAPCEGSCVLGINNSPVTIKAVEASIIEHAFESGDVVAKPPSVRTGKRVAVVGSGPAGLAVAELRDGFESIVLAGGSTIPRDLTVPGRELSGIHFAMEFLTLQNRQCEGDRVPVISAKDKNVIIIGGGDTGADCLGTAHRQGAVTVRQLELLSRPPDSRAASNPWPLWPNIFRTSSAHEEGGERMYSIATTHFSGNSDGEVTALHAHEVETKIEDGRMSFKPIAGTEFAVRADLVLLAMGFLGPEKNGMLTDLGVKMTERGTVWRDENWMTSVPGVFTAGDMQRGQSLIVWAIAEGRSCARGVDTYLMGASELPAPLP